MGLVDVPVRTIACDVPGCLRTLTFARTEEKAVFDNPENSWLKTTRTVSTADGRVIVYCSDICEVEGVETGKHNLLEAPKVIPAGNAAAVAAAAQSAANAKNAEQALRSGQPTKIQVTDR